MLSRKDQTFVIIATTIGGIIEWYELFLYVYWTPIISKLFFVCDTEAVAAMKTLFIFFVGFVARPIGGLIFGHIGDKHGRRTSFVWSIFFMTIPSFAMGLLPSSSLGLFAPVVLCILRFFQGLPAGGELPGAMCYLAESAPPQKRSLICSFSFFGPQIGVIISMIECFLFEKFIPHEDLISWGWRLSFILGGLLGVLGFYIRKRLKETPAFQKLEREKMTVPKPIMESITRHKKELVIGFFASFVDVVGFYMFSIFLGIYFNHVLNISNSDNLLITSGVMIISTVTLPILGSLGDKYSIKKLLTGSALGMILFAYPFYLAASTSCLYLTTFLEVILMLFLNVQFAILPCFIAELFPTTTRYTGIGLSFNLCDSILGGITPILALFLAFYVGTIAAFLVLITIAAMISIVAFSFVKENRIILRDVD